MALLRPLARDTLRESENATEAANRTANAAEAAERAHVYPTFELNKIGATYQVEGIIVNVGRTPARFVDYFAMTRFRPEQSLMLSQKVLPFLKANDYKVVFTEKFTKEEISAFALKQQSSITVQSYYDVFGAKYNRLQSDCFIRNVSGTFSTDIRENSDEKSAQLKS